MDIKKSRKIRKYLGDEYHLTEYWEFYDESSWKLFEKHDGWLYDNSECIMSSDKNTEDELLKFAKKHRTYNLTYIHQILYCVSSIVNIIHLLILIFIKNAYIKGFSFGTMISLFSVYIFISHAYDKNIKESIYKNLEYIKRNEKK